MDKPIQGPTELVHLLPLRLLTGSAARELMPEFEGRRGKEKEHRQGRPTSLLELLWRWRGRSATVGRS
jgi:hypothetical protein